MTIKELLSRYIGGYGQLTKQLDHIPEQAIHFKPTPNTWSISDIIVHLADSEAYGFIRAKKIIAECGDSVTVYNQQIWSERLFYDQMNYLDALEIIRLLRKSLYEVLKLVSAETWQNYIYHPETGKISLVDWIQQYTTHIDVHVEQINSNYEDWKKLKRAEPRSDIWEQAVSYIRAITLF